MGPMDLYGQICLGKPKRCRPQERQTSAENLKWSKIVGCRSTQGKLSRAASREAT